jgi:hypothetical protein
MSNIDNVSSLNNIFVMNNYSVGSFDISGKYTIVHNLFNNVKNIKKYIEYLLMLMSINDHLTEQYNTIYKFFGNKNIITVNNDFKLFLDKDKNNTIHITSYISKSVTIKIYNYDDYLENYY